ncbi:hypothetical protein EDC56_2166 [Sinobacterium caligoides]|uniref:Uncharacterized protein n=1 Tax=Sinobacterium caligoides TaxID=933926 RepID=A0A3N2DPI3_9GAMM|nr:hypothetical protein [Sinobacterium caligoides]ROS01721.1 hypothetical protein EDC56_2166 [Sinobacterium caligoides]
MELIEDWAFKPGVLKLLQQLRGRVKRELGISLKLSDENLAAALAEVKQKTEDEQSREYLAEIESILAVNFTPSAPKPITKPKVTEEPSEAQDEEQSSGGGFRGHY